MNFEKQSSGRRHTRLAHAHIVFSLTAALLALIFGFAVMLLWNAILPSLFSVHSVTYWQSVGLLVLARILLGGGLGYRRGFARLGSRPAWSEYEEWWRESGKQSFQEFSAERPNDQ
jgi:O-antigen/teichoic acid export membrane protein